MKLDRIKDILNNYAYFTCEIQREQVIKAMIVATDEAEREAIKVQEQNYVTDMT